MSFLVECTIRRPPRPGYPWGATVARVNGRTYTFKPKEQGGPHVCEIERSDDVQAFMQVEGENRRGEPIYRLVDEEQAKELKSKEDQTPEPVDAERVAQVAGNPSDFNAEQVASVLSSASDEQLYDLEQAERSGKARKGVFQALEEERARRAASNDDPDPE